MGSFIHIALYYIALLNNEADTNEYKVKTWHFAEAVSFFVFLVLAPVGLTEFARESKDQAGLQVQHEAQQQEIEALKAQIAILMKQAQKT